MVLTSELILFKTNVLTEKEVPSVIWISIFFFLILTKECDCILSIYVDAKNIKHYLSCMVYRYYWNKIFWNINM